MVVLIAPESAERAELAALLAQRGYQVTTADPAPAAVQKTPFSGEAVILDLAADGAMKVLRRHASQWRRIPLIGLADRRRPSSASDALRLGAADIVPRPVRIDDVQAALANVAELHTLPKDDAPDPARPTPQASGEGVFGISPSMQDAMALVRRIAPSGCNVVIIGERGTGREMIARAIHARSPRKDGPFVKIAGAAAEPGDFAPLFELPDGGRMTLYVEDMGELRTAAQAALELGVRPRRTRTPARPETERLRVVASAEPGLFELAERRVISRDLVEMLAVVRIDLAPLRQRPDDVQMLAVHFLKGACREAGIPSKTFSRGALQLIRALPWRGNAAELKSLCERLTVLTPRGGVQLEDVLAHVRLDAPEAIGRPQETLRQARDRFERDYISAVVQQNRGRIGAAAKQLGIERTNLYRKLKQLNISL